MANPQTQDSKQTPAEPKTPTDSDYGCAPLPDGPTPPTLADPTICEPRCDCPTPPPGTGTCFDKLIADQAKVVDQADRAKQSKAELEEMLSNANTAKQSYTRDKYKDFKQRWEKQDQDIVAAIETVTCNIKCWWCVIECEICPLLYKIREIEERLDGSGQLISEVHSLRDLQYWHERNVAAKTRVFDRINDVMKAWKDPATTIDAALKVNDDVIKAVRSMEPADGLRRVFFELIPRHLAIAPRPLKTKIDPKYIELCSECDPGEPDECCGPDVSLPTARQRLIKPQAYIVDPDHYFHLLCCLATQRYLPAKEQQEKAISELADVNAKIDSYTTDLARRIDDPLADYRGNIVTPIDCDNYKKKNGNGCGDDGEQTTEQTAR